MAEGDDTRGEFGDCRLMSGESSQSCEGGGFERHCEGGFVVCLEEGLVGFVLSALCARWRDAMGERDDERNRVETLLFVQMKLDLRGTKQ